MSILELFSWRQCFVMSVILVLWKNYFFKYIFFKHFLLIKDSQKYASLPWQFPIWKAPAPFSMKWWCSSRFKFRIHCTNVSKNAYIYLAQKLLVCHDLECWIVFIPSDSSKAVVSYWHQHVLSVLVMLWLDKLPRNGSEQVYNWPLWCNLICGINLNGKKTQQSSYLQRVLFLCWRCRTVLQQSKVVWFLPRLSLRM